MTSQIDLAHRHDRVTVNVFGQVESEVQLYP